MRFDQMFRPFEMIRKSHDDDDAKKRSDNDAAAGQATFAFFMTRC